MRVLKRSWLSALLWCGFGIFLLLGFMEANAISQFHGISLRYSTPINGQAAQRARQYSIANAGADNFWPTFWRESRAELSTGTRAVQSRAISFSGDAALVWPAEFLTGSAPSSIDAKGIAVSEPLARRLWGSTDIIGMPVYAEGKPRIVRGVFEGAVELALLSYHIEDTSQSWTAVELAGGMPHSTRNNAEGFAAVSGLGRPDYVLMGGAMTLARFMAVFPLLMLALFSLVLCAGHLKKHYRAAITPVIFAGLILFAFLLPHLLNVLPPWIIPTHWSDFSFWSLLFRQASESLREFLILPPMLRDVELKLRLLRQGGILFCSICLGVAACVRFCRGGYLHT